MDIKKFSKSGKNIVIELDDEIEYILSDRAIEEMEADKEIINLIRLIDNTVQQVSIRRINWALQKEGAIDYLDKK